MGFFIFFFTFILKLFILKIMNATAQKLELIQWISNLDDIRLLQEVAAFRKRNQSKTQSPKRFFGCGKGVFGEIAEDFNEPLDIFDDYKP
jgi:hypothetical protein